MNGATESEKIVESMMLKPCCSVGFASCLLGVSRQRVYNLLDSGKLERVELCGSVCVALDSIAAVIRKRSR